jgi:hypothetical protein
MCPFEYVSEVKIFLKMYMYCNAFSIKHFSWNDFETQQKFDTAWMHNAFLNQFWNVLETLQRFDSFFSPKNTLDKTGQVLYTINYKTYIQPSLPMGSPVLSNPMFRRSPISCQTQQKFDTAWMHNAFLNQFWNVLETLQRYVWTVIM